jgi:FKBP-type peptidyl-prolyl cis-trans isomerase FklB
MKQTSRIAIVFVTLIITLIGCSEDKYIDWKLRNDEWLTNLVESNKNDPNFVTTSTGLSYRRIYQGLGRRAQPTSTVIVNYEGRLIDGSVFGKGDVDTLSLKSVVAGWREGVSKMNNGGSYIIYIPSTLGYDTVSTNAKIPPYSTLIFKVELLDSQN